MAQSIHKQNLRIAEREVAFDAGVPGSANVAVMRIDESRKAAKDAPQRLTRSPAQVWLNWQCKMISGMQSGAIYAVRASKLQSVCACWPDSSESRSVLLKLACKALVNNSTTVLSKMSGQNMESDLLAVKIHTTAAEYIVALRFSARSEAQQQAVIQLLQWGGIWLGSLDELVSGNESVPTNASVSTDSMQSAVLELDSVHGACLEIVNRLVSELGCERVSIGLRKNFSTRLEAISQTVDFDRRRQMVKNLEAAMDEAADQSTSICLPWMIASEMDDMPLAAAHEALRKFSDGLATCSLLIKHREQLLGMVVLERGSAQTFTQPEIDRATALLECVAPVLGLQISKERSVRESVVNALYQKFNGLRARSTGKNLLVASIGVLFLCGLAFLPVTHRVIATASIEGSDKQVLVASRAGYVKSANFRAGDVVTAGQEIAVLDDRDLLIEQNRWEAELAKLDTSYAQALSSRQRSEVGVLQARKQQISAELNLVKQKLARGVLRAPFDGVLVSGDLNQSLGAPVAAGDTLFEIASLQSYRLMLEIDEHDVAGVQPGLVGSLRIAALPGRTYGTKLVSVVPVALTRETGTVFRVEAALVETSDVLRPGMQGVAKIELGNRSLVWILTHGMIDRLRLWFWKVGIL